MTRVLTLPRNAQCTMRPVRDGQVMRAATGGARLPVSRMGDHWAMEVDTGALSTLAARALTADILSAGAEPVRIAIPQPGVQIGPPGAPRVKGAGQSGSSIELDGFPPYALVQKGRFITIETGGEGRAYLVDVADTVANASGEITLALWPMLHVEPSDNDVVEVVSPYIEGLIAEGGDHASGLLAAVTPDQFEIEEQD